MRHRIIAAGLRAVALSGADRWLVPIARGRGLILTFHHVRPPSGDAFQPNALLEITPEHLDLVIGLLKHRGYEIVPLSDVAGRLTAPGRKPFAVLTFDDGYRDNRDHAAPVLRRHDVPWTMFVTTEFASGTGRLWWIELEEVVRRSDRLVLATEAGPRDLPATDAAAKRAAFATAYRALRAGPEDRLREVIGGWCDEVGLDRPALVRSLCLGWQELREWVPREPGLAIGAHTLSHPMLAKHDAAVARREIVDARRIIREELGIAVDHLAYPVGDPTSAGAREFALAQEAGYRSAVTTRPGHLFAAHAQHPTALPRISVNGLHQGEAAMRALVSGVPFLAWNRLRRVNVG